MKRLSVLLAVIMLAAWAAPVQAATVIDFKTGAAGPGGTIQWLADGNVIGSDIPIQLLNVSSAPANNGNYVVGGPGTDSQGATNLGVLSFSTGGAGGNFVTIFGNIPGMGIATSTNLLSGSFSSYQVQVGGLTSARGPDSKAEAMLTWIGLPIDTPFAYFGFSLATADNLVRGGDAVSVVSTDFRNTAVPEPGSMLLLGTGLFGLAGAVRRRMKK